MDIFLVDLEFVDFLGDYRKGEIFGSIENVFFVFSGYLKKGR